MEAATLLAAVPAYAADVFIPSGLIEMINQASSGLAHKLPIPAITWFINGVVSEGIYLASIALAIPVLGQMMAERYAAYLEKRFGP